MCIRDSTHTHTHTHTHTQSAQVRGLAVRGCRQEILCHSLAMINKLPPATAMSRTHPLPSVPPLQSFFGVWNLFYTLNASCAFNIFFYQCKIYCHPIEFHHLRFFVGKGGETEGYANAWNADENLLKHEFGISTKV